MTWYKCWVSTASADLGGALHLWALPTTERSAISAEGTYDSLVALAAALPSSTSTPVAVLHASAGAESVCGEPVRTSASALAVGPVLVLPTELPGLRMRSVDLECREGVVDTAAAIASLTREVGLDDAEPQVAHRFGQPLGAALRADCAASLRRRSNCHCAARAAT